MSDFMLTPEQQQRFDQCENTNDNILIAGKPGVGKSVLIRALLETGSKHYTLAAPTGLAALNIGGKTLHSVFGIVPSDGAIPPDYNNFTQNDYVINHLRYRVNHLIVDETSMVRADLLDFIDRELREIKERDLPFGGVQIILVGDFFQLPPVTKVQDLKDLTEYGYKSQFAFDAKSFTDFRKVELSTVLRQNDKEFLDILHAARYGGSKLTATMIKLLNKQVGKSDGIRISLTATNKQADIINTKQLSLLKSEVYTSGAIKYGYWPANPVEMELSLKVGAQVMVKKNNADKDPSIKGQYSGRIVNGTLCKIAELPTKEHNYFVVELEDGSTHKIFQARWERRERTSNGGGKYIDEVKATYTQWPFQLAWAISMHKSQGMTFDRVHIDPSRVFEAGQLYVAVSRCRTLEGISLQSPIRKEHFMTNPHVLAFDKTLQLITG